jgi:hypothetical protein
MKTEFIKVMDFLETQQQEDKHTTNQLHLIIQTLCTFLDDEQLQEVENFFYFKNNTSKDFRIEYQDKDKNELFLSIVTAVDLEDATDYANKLMAETKINDLYTFVITEL